MRTLIRAVIRRAGPHAKHNSKHTGNSHMKRLLLLCALSFAPCGALLAAGNAWDGTWKLDVSKSHLIGDTFTYSKSANGMLHFDDGSTTSYDFNADGKDYPSYYDRTTNWTAAGKNAWDSVTKVNGKTINKAHRTLSADGNTLTLNFTATRPDGSSYHEQDVYTRIGGNAADGLLGKWRSTKVDASTPDSFVISTPAAGVIRWEIPEQKATVQGKADGSDNPVKGPNIPPGMTLGFTQSKADEIRYAVKYNGKPDGYG